MKKMLAGLLGLALSALIVVPAGAQNLPPRYDSYCQGVPCYSMNATGSNYGLLQNNGSASWALGYGSSQSSNGTTVVMWNSSGNVAVDTTATGAYSLYVQALNASTTGQIVNNPASSTADLAEFQANATNVVRVGAQGHVQFRQYTMTQINTLTPDFVGAKITVTNHGNTTICPGGYCDCMSTGTAVAQWAVVGSTHGFNGNGCGTGQ